MLGHSKRTGAGYPDASKPGSYDARRVPNRIWVVTRFFAGWITPTEFGAARTGDERPSTCERRGDPDRGGHESGADPGDRLKFVDLRTGRVEGERKGLPQLLLKTDSFLSDWSFVTQLRRSPLSLGAATTFGVRDAS